MKIKKITAQNFIGARDIDVVLDRPVAIFAGCNGAGKSSLQEAVRMALVGESVRIGLKKDYAQLVSQGADSGFAEVETDKGTCSIVLPGGKGTHGGGDALRFVLDAQRFARLEPNERRAFLFGLTGIGINAKDIAERMAARGCDDGKASSIAAFLRAGFDAAQKEAQTKARECKAAWKSTANGETYGSQKAATWAAVKPDVDMATLETARADLRAMEAEIETETTRLGELQGRAKHAVSQSARLNGLRQQAGAIERVKIKLEKDAAECAEWETKVTNAQSKSVYYEAHYECPDCGSLLQIKNTRLVKYTPPDKAEHADAVLNLPEYERALNLLRNAVANGKRDLAQCEAAAQALAEVETAVCAAPPSDEIDALSARIAALKHTRANQQTAIRLLEDAERAARDADEKTRRAAALHADVQQWEAIADALAPDGIPGEMLTEALGPINNRLLSSSGIAEWGRVVIHSDMRVTAELRDYNLLSESEKWRADAMIAEAISHLSGIKLLVLDRFDVLDVKGRSDLVCWLDAIAARNEIDTALIFGTLKAAPYEDALPQTFSAYWIENGTIKAEAAERWAA